jgi:hypothetical protein
MPDGTDDGGAMPGPTLPVHVAALAGAASVIGDHSVSTMTLTATVEARRTRHVFCMNPPLRESYHAQKSLPRVSKLKHECCAI